MGLIVSNTLSPVTIPVGTAAGALGGAAVGGAVGAVVAVPGAASRTLEHFKIKRPYSDIKKIESIIEKQSAKESSRSY